MKIIRYEDGGLGVEIENNCNQSCSLIAYVTPTHIEIEGNRRLLYCCYYDSLKEIMKRQYLQYSTQMSTNNNDTYSCLHNYYYCDNFYDEVSSIFNKLSTNNFTFLGCEPLPVES